MTTADPVAVHLRRDGGDEPCPGVLAYLLRRDGWNAPPERTPERAVRAGDDAVLAAGRRAVSDDVQRMREKEGYFFMRKINVRA